VSRTKWPGRAGPGARPWQWEVEALKDNVISFFGPEDESVVKAPPGVADLVLKDVRRDEAVDHGRAHSRGAGQRCENRSRMRKSRRRFVGPYLGTGVLLLVQLIGLDPFLDQAFRCDIFEIFRHQE
jgi:hypothetical protein